MSGWIRAAARSRGGWTAWRPALLAAAAASGLAAAVPTAARAAPEAIVIGDSLGVGVSMASGLTRLARNSVAIRGGAVLDQIRQAAPGSVVFMSLGTNDAVGRIDGLDGDIGRIVAASRDVKLVWIGPPCVLKSWDASAERLDGVLKARTRGTGVTYVSMRDPGMCAPGSRAKDGVHFTMAGYGMLWAKARVTAGYEGGAARTMVAGPAKRGGKRRTARRRANKAVVEAGATPGPSGLSTEAPRPPRASRPRSADAER